MYKKALPSVRSRLLRLSLQEDFYSGLGGCAGAHLAQAVSS